jgi:N-acetylglucosaminyldiphosphoundecaprenol N-acetyl-beta-D-mannosaminyltransferase
MITRLPILNIWIDTLTMDTALARVAEFVRQGDRVHTVFAANPEKNFSVPKDPMLYSLFRDADLLLPDGIGMVLAARLLHRAKLERVPGCEFMERCCAFAAKNGYPIFLYGAKEEVNAKAASELVRKYPGLVIAGRQDGYLPEERMVELVERINASGARFLFLALGSPRQEKWVAKHGGMLTTVSVCQGIGGTLDVIAGTVQRAPQAWCKLGLEWLYRLLAEPKRIARQKALPVFAWLVAKAYWRQIVGLEPAQQSLR